VVIASPLPCPPASVFYPKALRKEKRLVGEEGEPVRAPKRLLLNPQRFKLPATPNLRYHLSLVP